MNTEVNTTENTNEHANQSLISQILFPHVEIPTVKPEMLSQPGSWAIANTTTFLWFITFLFVIFYFVAKRFTLVPGFFQSLVEMLMESINNLVNSLAGGRENRIKELFFPITAIFLIIGSINIIGSFPIITQITWHEGNNFVPFFRKATSDINVTLPLALAIVLTVQFFGIKNWGFFGYFKRFLPIHILWHETKAHGIGGFFMGLIEIFVGLLELVSEFVKVISLSLRLFGNMFAGEILLAILSGIFAIALPAVWMGFDFMVAIIQTLVLGCLASVYYLMVVKEPGQEGGH